MKDFMLKCDYCRSIVIDTIDNFQFYTRSVYYVKLNKFKIKFYCPGCIKKYKIKTDSLNDNAYYLSEF